LEMGVSLSVDNKKIEFRKNNIEKNQRISG
jgi:hypothetical protein